MAAPTGPAGRRSPFLRLFRLIAGWVLLVVGFAGLFLPVLQGVLMIAAGLALLSGESRFIKRQIDRVRPYFRLWRLRYNAWRSRRRGRSGGSS